MSARRCPQLGLVEAAEDGRLSEQDRASLERHVKGCAACAGELARWRALAETARRLPLPGISALERRRQRRQLLARANERLLESPARTRRRDIGGGAILVAALSLLLVPSWPSIRAWLEPGALEPGAVELDGSEARPPEVGVSKVRASKVAASEFSASNIPSYRVVSAIDADWFTEEQGAALRLRLRRGRLELEVSPLAAGQRFSLGLPDGELEVRGTRFVVSADVEHTRAASVSEGRVALRLWGQPERTLDAGQSWSAPVEPERVPRPASERTQGENARRMPAKALLPEPPVAGADFVAAMSAFSARDYARAEALLAAFERAHPEDARTEDAAFLRALCRARQGDVVGAQRLASEFLRRYPEGLRREEAERLAR